ncbi:hypothetical protein [Terricaulis sp.]|uniref:hypothetical protein n=1 Tax=Terricaulis sp. TaxID=2768686 RepID=UPI003783DCA0
MNAIGKSSVVFVTLSGLFWGGWVVGSQTPEGQEALAKAYEAYSQQRATQSEDLFAPTALRAIVCGAGGEGMERSEPKPCLAVVAAGRLFIVDAGSGAASALADRNIPMARLEAVLLTSASLPQAADLDEMFVESSRGRGDTLLPVYGPAETQRMVDGLNQAAGFDGAARGLQAWGPAPEPGRSVIVFEGDGLVVSAFTTPEDAFQGRVGYRFDYRGRSIVVGGDGRVVGAQASVDADVVLQSAQYGASLMAAQAESSNAGLVVLTGAESQVEAQQQVAQARAAGMDDVIAGRMGTLIELPLENSQINVRPL